MRETIRTHDAELYVGWPTTPDDLERDQSVQVGVRYGVDARWAVLTSPDQAAELRRVLQRASRAVWPSVFGPVAAGLVPPADDRASAQGGVLPPGDVTFGEREQVVYPDGSVRCERELSITDEAKQLGLSSGQEPA
jgi:hypothetical protein